MAASGLGETLRLALIQLKVHPEKKQTLTKVKEFVQKAVNNKASLVCLPECFNCPYGTQYFAEYAENIPGESSNVLATLAKTFSVHIIGGSLPEKVNGKLYNTCLIYGPDGEEIGKHRKVHMFDIDVPGGIKFKESDVLSPGDKPTVFQIGPWKVGVGICYDLRFPDLSRHYYNDGCNLLVYPGAFNMTTGPKHWELLTRARACDHQLYTAVCSPARDEEASYIAWGHSTICDPWAQVIGKLDHTEGILYADLDLNEVEKVRTAIPISKQQRPDVYS